jgi:exopolyphosphatase / guanosine-5'-triphosphate,3'-diphosphate pyrophosphatase
MRLGIIDLGTNSVRFDVHQLGSNRRISRLHREKLMIRLGQGVFLNGSLNKSAIQRTLHAFLRFKRVASHLKTEKIIAFGTSALREAADRDRLIEQIRRRSGIEIRVISGDEEAKLIARGILSNEKLGKGRFALVDIGGGSTEISICRGKSIEKASSFNLGTARLQQVFLKAPKPDARHLDELRAYIRTTIHQKMATDRWPDVGRIIGSSGTIRALGKILKRRSGSHAIGRKDLHQLVDAMSRMTQAEILAIPGMEPKRADMILAGAILLEECMKALGASKVAPTEFSLRDGILEEERQLFQTQKTSHLAFHLPDLLAAAKKFGANEAHVEKLSLLAEDIFDAMKPLHHLKPQWKIYLSAATILKNTGEAVSLLKHEVHSHYIVKNMDFPASAKWEQDFVAALCLHQKSSKVERKKLPFKEDKARTSAFMKLLAILQVIDALDAGKHAELKFKRLALSRGSARIQYTGKKTTGLESLNVELRSSLFEKVFKKRLSAEEV